ncbi:hypothetical protein J7L05_07025 [bacterium]|nr:hypothetical protein [bacterium]
MVKRFRYNVVRFLINRENDGEFAQCPGKGMPGYDLRVDGEFAQYPGKGMPGYDNKLTVTRLESRMVSTNE